MDAESDGALSRAPELEDVVGICRALNDEGVRYLLIGGFAVILHGFVRTTKDIEFLIDASDENVRAVKRARLKDTYRPSDHVDVAFLKRRLDESNSDTGEQ